MKPTTALTREEEAEGHPRISEESFMPPCVHITVKSTHKVKVCCDQDNEGMLWLIDYDT